MAIHTHPEWRTENDLRAFPFSENCIGDSLDFISDAKFFIDSRTYKSIYLSHVATVGQAYSLTFRYVSTDAVAISGELPIDIQNKDRVYLYDSVGSTSLAVITPGPKWGSLSTPVDFSPSFSSMDDSIASIGVQTIQRLVIEEKPRPLKFNKDIAQAIRCGNNVDANTVDINGNTVVEISAGFKYYDDKTSQSDVIDAIKTINLVKPTSSGAFAKLTEDCLSVIGKPLEDIITFDRDENKKIKTDANKYPLCVKTGSVCNTRNDIDENSIRFGSACLPCCSCSDYSRISKAITKLNNEFSAICVVLDEIFAQIASNYNQAVIKINDNKTPITRIRALRLYKNTIKMSFQNTCSLEIYGSYGINIKCSEFTFIEKHTKKEEADPIYGAIARYNTVNSNTREVVSATHGYYIGLVGPIPPGQYIDLIFEVNPMYGDLDLHDYEISIIAESTGYFGENNRVGCKKDVYAAKIIRDDSPDMSQCNPNDYNRSYQVITEDIAP